MLTTLFVVPPINLLLLLLLALALRRGGLALVFAVMLLGLALPIVSRGLLVSLERGLRTVPVMAPGAIVILGADLAEGMAGGRRVFSPGALTLERLRDGAALARSTGLPVLVSGGRIRSGEPAEAAVMAASLASDFGVTARWVEPGSVDTWENARRSAAMLRVAGVASVWVVSSPWHLRRGVLAFRRAGLQATAAPVAMDVAAHWPLGLLPSPWAWAESFYALHEWLGILWYWLRP